MNTTKLILCFFTFGYHLHHDESIQVQSGLSAVNSESTYVRREPLRKRGPFVANPYADVDEEEEEYGDRTDYR